MTFRAVDLQNLVNEHGVSVTLRSRTTGLYDPATGVVSQTNSDATVKAYFGNYMLNEVNGSTIIDGDRKVVVNTLDTSGTAITEPEVDDLIIGEGDTVSIVSVQKIKSGSTVVCYVCQARE